MFIKPIVLFGKMVLYFCRLFNLGAGGTWPGEIALAIKPNILADLFFKIKKGIIVISGTNGKTTTALMIQKILEKNGDEVIHNSSGANLLNGIVSAFIQKSNWLGKINTDWGVLEVDENILPIMLAKLKAQNLKRKTTTQNLKLIICLLNLFRDQLDRYGEVDIIAEKWSQALQNLPDNTTVILNADDPQVACLGKNLKLPVKYFGLDNPKYFLTRQEHATDSIFCVNCGTRLSYKGVYYSHIGIWCCLNCGLTRPKPHVNRAQSNLSGLYNQYNSLTATAIAQELNINQQIIDQVLNSFHPAFGRQEEFKVNGKKVTIFLSKNPTGFNVSLRTVMELITNSHSRPDRESIKKDSRFRGNDRESENVRDVILLALNDRVPDGRDVSWIWDVDFEMIPETVRIVVSGDRVYDLALRIKYSNITQNSKLKAQNYNSKLKTYYLSSNLIIEPNLKEALNQGLELIDPKETLFILPTYSAMLEVRKILTGRKIL